MVYSDPMWLKIWLKLQTSMFGGAVIVGSAWIVSKFLGLVKQRLIFTAFPPAQADSIFAAFAIPDFIYGTLILGSLLTALMPVFMAAWRNNQDEAWRITRSIMRIVAAVFFCLGLILLFGAGPIVRLLVGRDFSPDAQATTAHLMRIMSMNMMLFGVSNVFAAVLQSFKQFLAVSITPIVYNLSVIAGIVLFTPSIGPAGVAYGALAGALLHTIIQGIGAWRAGWRFGPTAAWRDSSVREIGRLLVPRTIGQSVTQIDQFVNVPIATRLGEGQLSIFRVANDIQDAPISIIGVSMATVAFPVFVELLNQGKRQEFIKHFSTIVRQILFLIIPLTVLILQLRAQVVRVFFGAPNVTWDVTIATAQTLGFFAISFFAQSLIPVLARSFYAMHDTKTPVRITTMAVALDIIGSIILGFTMGVQGLALSFSISSIVNATVLLITLHRRLGNLDDERILNSTLKIIGTTLLMALTVQGTKIFLVSFGLDLSHFVGVLAQAVIAGGVGVLAYIVFAVLFQLDEASLIQAAVQRIRNLFSSRPSSI